MTGGVTELDLHGKNAHQARVALDAALRRAGGDLYRLRVIHGCHSGSRLRELVREEYHHPRVLRTQPVDPSVTDLILREF